jgi:hypothetical protein
MRDHQGSSGLCRAARASQTSLTHFAELVEFTSECKLRRVVWQVGDRDFLDPPLREPALHGADVFLETPHHSGVEVSLTNLYATDEPLWLQYFKQSREAVGMTIVRRRGKEQPVLEMARKVAHRPGKSAVDRIAPTGRRGGVMGLIEYQKALGTDGACLRKPGAHVGRVAFID